MKKTTVKLLDDIIRNEFNETRNILLSQGKPIANKTLKRYVFDIRTKILTLCLINNDIKLTQQEKEFVNIMVTSNTIKLANFIDKCSENVSKYYIGVYLNSTRDTCVESVDKYYSEQIHKEFETTLTKLFELYTDMTS